MAVGGGGGGAQPHPGGDIHGRPWQWLAAEWPAHPCVGRVGPGLCAGGHRGAVIGRQLPTVRARPWQARHGYTVDANPLQLVCGSWLPCGHGLSTPYKPSMPWLRSQHHGFRRGIEDYQPGSC
jgi:hypothetical protein